MDAFQLLKADHRKVAELFDRLEAGSGKRRLEVFKQIKTELELHTHLEEKIFYPALEKPQETHELILEAYEEHDVVKKLLRELSRARNADEEWQAQAKVLRENVEHHVEEEENELFKKANQALTEQEIDDLGERLQAEKERKQGGQATTKKSGSKKAASASKAASRSTAAKTARRSRSKKSAAKKR